uniref:AlNc14C245G9544 protein n=1 Tax=Albugo laibachii Nc14 TaxID=890382 RepID=F0WT60_9STRA|nr:AlNc14C245G9544 [Albugo laibachii Nc14]CCA25964.1 AlNc14C337G10740 [Albugo laibachii Nc14]|eukprot:CCA25964.1 AlNc14C337G10740 [Albugo laibachii Nc14]
MLILKKSKRHDYIADFWRTDLIFPERNHDYGEIGSVEEVMEDTSPSAIMPSKASARKLEAVLVEDVEGVKTAATVYFASESDRGDVVWLEAEVVEDVETADGFGVG